MIWQIALVIVIAAILFPRVRRMLKTTLGIVISLVLIFALVVMMANGI